jgi:hypothetical protein
LDISLNNFKFFAVSIKAHAPLTAEKNAKAHESNLFPTRRLNFLLTFFITLIVLILFSFHFHAVRVKISLFSNYFPSLFLAKADHPVDQCQKIIAKDNETANLRKQD